MSLIYFMMAYGLFTIALTLHVYSAKKKK